MKIRNLLYAAAFAVGITQYLVTPNWAAQSYTAEDLNIEDAVKAAGPNLLGQAAVRSGFTSAHSFRSKRGSKADDLGVIASGPNTGGSSLGLLRSGDHTTANGVNDDGIVVGSTNVSFGSRPCRKDLPGLPPPGNCPMSAVHAVIWKAGALFDIGTLPGDAASEAFGINKHGAVVGFSSGPNGARGFLWTPTNGMQNLGTLPGGEFSKAFGINDKGLVVGSSGSSTGTRAVLWDPTIGIQDLGVFPGDTISEALGISNRGVVVGYSRGATGTHAFLWSSGNGMSNLAALPGGSLTRAVSLNEAGQVVGNSGDARGARAVVWDETGAVRDLNTLVVLRPGVTLLSAVGINENGQILALGSDDKDHHGAHEGSSRVFLLTP
jgi:probable HAF family extracellular repeat protein